MLPSDKHAWWLYVAMAAASPPLMPTWFMWRPAHNKGGRGWARRWVSGGVGWGGGCRRVWWLAEVCVCVCVPAETEWVIKKNLWAETRMLTRWEGRGFKSVQPGGRAGWGGAAKTASSDYSLLTVSPVANISYKYMFNLLTTYEILGNYTWS